MQNHKQLCMQANLDGSLRVEEKIIQKYTIMSNDIYRSKGIGQWQINLYQNYPSKLQLVFETFGHLMNQPINIQKSPQSCYANVF